MSLILPEGRVDAVQAGVFLIALRNETGDRR